MQLPFEEFLKALIAECYAKRNFIFALFFLISLTILFVGAGWPKIYTTFTIIHVDEKNILQSLMKGTAETTQAIDHAANAREIILGEKIMNEIINDPNSNWQQDNPSEVDEERIKEGIRKRIEVKGLGDNLLRISYRDNDPARAFITAKSLADLFIREGEKAKSKESKAAYDFIEKQVNEYLKKLTKAEDDLRRFRSDNPDARPGLETEVSTRISRHQREIEQARLELREAEISKKSIENQLSGEAAITISQSREGQYRAKIADLNEVLERLRLDYKETYPDIVRIKHQISDLKISMEQEIKKRNKAKLSAKKSGDTFIDEAILLNPIYQQLRSQAAATETKIATLRARIHEKTKMLNAEFERAKKIHGGEAELSQLTRDYDVNQGIYQDLLRRRENARVSKSLDQEKSGLTYNIQEPAKLPLIPTGLRFLHFMIGGLVLGLIIPVGLIVALLQLDPRVRFSQVISSELKVPVLVEARRIRSYSEISSEKVNLVLLLSGVIFVLIVYGYLGWIKFVGNV